jgi:cupin 2 domain-containing protein
MNTELNYNTGNLFNPIVIPTTGEIFETILRSPHVYIERIVSSATPEQQLYNQAQDEWVCLLQGTAQLWIDSAEIILMAGDYYFIPAHTPHRVMSTSTAPPCIWLAIHFYAQQ